jgi:hypothetical protein
VGLELGAVATTLVDSPPAVQSEPKPAGAPAGPPPASDQPPPAVDRACAKCGAPMASGQDWCVQCGAAAPGSSEPAWRSAATILAVTALLALGAAAAAYAALNKTPSRPATVTTTVAQATPAPTSTPTTPTPATPKPALPLGTIKPPKIPLTATVPKVKIPTTPSTGTTGGSTNTSTSTQPTGAGTGGTSQPTPILLDTNAAATYNPYNYPATDFGDPSLAIDGDATTGWTAQIDPVRAPKMAEGILINLKSHQKIAAVKLTTSTPGMTVQVYGATGHTAPTSITDPAWVPLSRYRVAAKKRVRIKLKHSTKAFRYLTLWISNAPASAVGTPAAPGHVSVDELELFPAG